MVKEQRMMRMLACRISSKLSHRMRPRRRWRTLRAAAWRKPRKLTRRWQKKESNRSKERQRRRRKVTRQSQRSLRSPPSNPKPASSPGSATKVRPAT